MGKDKIPPTGGIPSELAPFASRFEFAVGGLTYTIERYDNHGRFLPDGGWCVACWFTKGGVPNVHYLGNAGWRYKYGCAYPSAADAWAAFCAASPPTG